MAAIDYLNEAVFKNMLPPVETQIKATAAALRVKNLIIDSKRFTEALDGPVPPSTLLSWEAKLIVRAQSESGQWMQYEVTVTITGVDRDRYANESVKALLTLINCKLQEAEIMAREWLEDNFPSRYAAP